MAQIDYENGKVFVATKPNEKGVFNGIDILSINTAKTKENIEEPFDGYLNEVTIKNTSATDISKATQELYSNIEPVSTLGANFQPLQMSANVKLEGKEYLLIGSLENCTGGNNISPMKLFRKKEVTAADDDNTFELVEFNINNRVRVIDIKNAIDRHIDNFKANGLDKYPNGLALLTSLSTIPDGIKKDEKGFNMTNVTSKNIQYFAEALKKYDDKDPLVENFFNYMTENKILMNINAIFNNVSNDDIEIKSTKIDKYQIVATEPKEENANSFTLTYKNRANQVGNDIDKFKKEYVSEEVRNDIQSFVKAAQSDVHTAFHLYNHINQELKNKLFDINMLRKEERGGTITPENKDRLKKLGEEVEKTIAKLGVSFESATNFNGAYYYSRFVKNKTGDKKDFAGFLDAFMRSIKKQLNYDNSVKELQLTENKKNIRGNSKVASIYYNGSLPKGTTIVQLEKMAELKGTMNKDLVASVTLEPTKIVFPAKTTVNNNGEEVKQAPVLLTPNKEPSFGQKLFKVLDLAKKINENGNIVFDSNPEKEYPDVLPKAIESLSNSKDVLEWKQNQKVKNTYTAILNELEKNKDKPLEIKKFVEDLQAGKSRKGLGNDIVAIQVALSQTKYDQQRDFENSITRNNVKTINRCLEQGAFVKQDEIANENIKKQINKIIGTAVDFSNAYNKVFEKQNELAGGDKTQTLLYKIATQRPKNDFVDKMTVSYTDQDGKQQEFINRLGNYKANQKLDGLGVEINCINDRKIILPTQDKVGNVINTVLQNTESDLKKDLTLAIEESRKARGEILQNSGFEKKNATNEALTQLLEQVKNMGGVVPENITKSIEESISNSNEEAVVSDNEIGLNAGTIDLDSFVSSTKGGNEDFLDLDGENYELGGEDYEYGEALDIDIDYDLELDASMSEEIENNVSVSEDITEEPQQKRMKL